MVHVRFDPSSVSLNDLDTNQFGSGEYKMFYGASPYQRGFGYYQRGTGVSDFFRTLWRAMLPLAKSAGKAIGHEALSTGSRILDKVAQGENIKNVAADEALTGVENLLQKARKKQSGGGSIKRMRKTRNSIISAKNNLIGKRVKITPPLSIHNKKRQRSDAFGFY